MSREADFHALVAALAGDPAARGLADDAAVLVLEAGPLVVTTDLLVEGVHYRAEDPPGDVAWKLVAVSLSDLAAKAARPVGALLGFVLGEAAWDRAFVAGLDEAVTTLGVPLLGGDTVASAAGAPRVLSLTALGTATCDPVPARGGAVAGDDLWVSGAIGDAGAGLAMLAGSLAPDPALVRRYRRPEPRVAAGQALGGLVSAMMDVSDGLLIDAGRIAAASGLAATIALDAAPLSAGYRSAVGEGRDARMGAVTAGDDYELLFAASCTARSAVAKVGATLVLPLTRIGRFDPGGGLTLTDRGVIIPLPDSLGYQHGERRDG